MRPFTQEDEKRAMSSLKDIFDNERAFAYYDKKVAKSEKAARVACLSLAINDLYGCHKEVDAEQGMAATSVVMLMLIGCPLLMNGCFTGKG